MPSVKEVIEQCEGLGLVVEQNQAVSSHTLWNIVEPKTGTILTGISSHAGRSGGDPNWFHNIRRMLRRAGYVLDFRPDQQKRMRDGQGPQKSRKGKGLPAIDLDALARAQAAARAAGEHVPTIDDLDEHPEFLSRSKIGPNPKNHPLSDEAIDVKVEIMAPKAETPRFNATVARLKKLLEEKGAALETQARERFAAEGKRYSVPEGRGARSEFVRIAIHEVAPARNLQAWKSESSGQQTLYTILDKGSKGATLWAVNLIEATMDHIDGLRWGVIDESKKRTAQQVAGDEAHSPGLDSAEPPVEPATPPQAEEAPDIETSIAIISQYEEDLRHILEYSVSHSLTDEEWETTTDKSGEAKRSVAQFMLDYQDMTERLGLAEIELTRLRSTPGASSTNPVADEYAKVLLDMLQKQDGKNSEMLTSIFERLDKLAGI